MLGVKELIHQACTSGPESPIVVEGVRKFEDRIAKLEAALRQSVEDLVIIRQRVSGLLHDGNASWERQCVELRICDDAATKARKALEE